MRATIAVGILSSSNNFCLREAQRKLFVTQARAYNSLDIKVLFLLDHPTPELDKEHRIYNDILYLNVTEHGWNNRFGKKLHTWYRYAVTAFPNATLIGRMDDDAFVCMPQMFEWLNQVKGKKSWPDFLSCTLSWVGVRDMGGCKRYGWV